MPQPLLTFPALPSIPHPPTAQSIKSSAISARVEDSVPPAFAVTFTHLQPLAACHLPVSLSGCSPGPVSSKNQDVIPLLHTLWPSHGARARSQTPPHSLASPLGVVLTLAHTTLLSHCHLFFSSNSLDSSLPPGPLHVLLPHGEHGFPIDVYDRFVLVKLSGVSYSGPQSVWCPQP